MQPIRLVHISDIHITAPSYHWFPEDWFNKRLPAWFNLLCLGRGRRFGNAERVLAALRDDDPLPGLAVPGNHDYSTPRSAAGLFERHFAAWQQGERVGAEVYPFAQ